MVTANPFEEELRNLAQFASAQLKIGESYLRESDIDTAREIFERLTTFSTHNVIPDDILAGAYIHLGEIARKQGELNRSEQAFWSAQYYMSNKAGALFRSKNWAAAIEAYQDLLKIGTPNIYLIITGHQQMGSAFSELGQHAAAGAEFQYVVDLSARTADDQEKLDFFQPTSFIDLAETYVQRNDFERARATINALLKRPNTHPQYFEQGEQFLKKLPPAP